MPDRTISYVGASGSVTVDPVLACFFIRAADAPSTLKECGGVDTWRASQSLFRAMREGYTRFAMKISH